MTQPDNWLPPDHEARVAALDTTRSFSVQAPAGSGKTELLTQRMLRLLAQVEIPEEVLAFTFTRKAAGEMRQRLITSLNKAAAMDPAALAQLSPHKLQTMQLALAVLTQDKQQQWRLLQNSHRLRIMTIDSFNHGLTAQLPLSASMGGAARITEDTRPILENAVHRLFARLESGDSTALLLGTLLQHLHNNLREAEQLLVQLLEKRDQWLPLLLGFRTGSDAPHTLLTNSLRSIIVEQLQQIRSNLLPFSNKLFCLVRFSCSNLADQPDHGNHLLTASDQLPSEDPEALAAWRALANFLLTTGMEFRKPGGLSIKQGFPAKSSSKDPELKAQYEQAKADFGTLVAALEDAKLLPHIQQLALLPDPEIANANRLVLNALIDLLPLLAIELAVAMQEAGKVDYTQTTLAALQALGAIDEPSDLALRLDYRIRHILVDEFQDTSTLQLNLLEMLTRGWEPDDGRTLFVVGDGMQSCYGFRNAQVRLFMQVRNQGIGSVSMVPLELGTNFRSDRGIVQAVNAVFSRAFPDSMDLAHGGVSYSASEARAGTINGQGVNLDLWIRADANDPDKSGHNQTEAMAVADRIQALQQTDPSQSIAILVRNRGHLAAIVPTLRQRGIAFNATEIDPLLSYPLVSDLFVLLKALLNLAEDVSWFALLRSPMLGLRLEDINRLAEQKQALGCTVWTLWQQCNCMDQISEDARLRFQRSLGALQQARQQLQGAPLRTVLETLWERLGGPACVSETWMMPNVESFLALVEQYDEAGEFNLNGFTARLRRIYGNVTAPDVRLTIQTIHKSKGLEYDAVLIPGLHRGGGRQDAPLLMWNEFVDAHNISRPVLALRAAKGQDRDALYDFLRHESGLRESNEATRLLYIAVTRAAHSAWLFAQAKQGKEQLETPSGSLLSTIEGVINSPPPELQVTIRQYADTGASIQPEANAERITAQPLRRLPSDWTYPLQIEADEPMTDIAEDEPQHLQLLARQIGELVHLGLQMIVEHGEQWFDAANPPPIFTARLAPVCETRQMLQSAVETVMSQLQACLASEHADWLFSTEHRDSACELALVDYSKGYRRDHVIDRTFIDEAGNRWIIDYKSSSPAEGTAIEDFIKMEVDRYQAQLQSYAALFADKPEQVRTALFFTSLPYLHEL